MYLLLALEVVLGLVIASRNENLCVHKKWVTGLFSQRELVATNSIIVCSLLDGL